METNLITEGLKFMVLGMGTVFVFLTIMIIVVNIMSYVVNRFFPEPQASSDTATGTNTDKNDKKKVVAAITAAIMHHREG